jgi:hypothetical protein
MDAPKRKATVCSRTSPSTRDAVVAIPTTLADRASPGFFDSDTDQSPARILMSVAIKNTKVRNTPSPRVM